MRYFYLLFISFFALSLPIYGYASAFVDEQASCPMQQSDHTMNKMDCCQGMSKVTHMCSSSSSCTTSAMLFLPVNIAAPSVVIALSPAFAFDVPPITTAPASIWRPPA